MKNGSKTDFYKWIDDIKKAYRHKEELEEKLKFYESRLIGYNAVTYDHVGSGTSKNNVESNLLYVIDKINVISSKLNEVYMLISEYDEFKKVIKKEKASLITYNIEGELSIEDICFKMKIGRSRYYQIMKSIKSDAIKYRYISNM